MYLLKLFLASIIFISSFQLRAADYSKIHTDLYRGIVPTVTGQQLPRFDVCLRHYLSGECLTDRPRVFTCDDPDINKYLSCITDPNLSKKISEAYSKMYTAAKKEVEAVKNSTTISEANKQIMLAKMDAAFKEYEELAKDEAKRLKQINDVLEKSQRFKIAETIRSPDFQSKLDQICSKSPKRCMNVGDYRKYGKKLLDDFKSEFEKANKKIMKEYGDSLDDMLKGELALIEKCREEKSTAEEVSKACQEFQPDQELMMAVSAEINKGVCNHSVQAQDLDQQTRERFKLICGEFYHQLVALAREQNNEDKQAHAPGGANAEEPKNAGAQKTGIKVKDGTPNGSSEGWVGGQDGGVAHNQQGIYSDWMSDHIKEQKYHCPTLEGQDNSNCGTEDSFQIADSNVMGLVNDTQKAALQCSKELDPYHKAQLDAASFMLETQIRAYIDRLNFDPTLSEQQYRAKLDELKLSCPVSVAKGECDYDSVVSTSTNVFVGKVINQAFNQRKKIGFNKDLGSEFLQDTVKAAQDLKDIDFALKEILGNFPEPGKSLKEVWPELFPCQSVVGIIDEIRNIWKSSNYNTRCAPIEDTENEQIWKEEEEFYQHYKAVELGLIAGKTLDDMPPERVAHYRVLKTTQGIGNDLDGISNGQGQQMHLDKKHSSMFFGTRSETGRMLVEPSTLTGLESRKLECKKKAEQAKKLVNMKLSILANYPQLGNKTFSDGMKPSKDWTYWDENCRGGNKYHTHCHPGTQQCETKVKVGCQKEPADWAKQDRPDHLYQQLGSDSSKFAEKIAKQFSIDQAQDELDTLKNSVKAMCKDPLKAGEEVLKDDKLYTLYATCALNNVQNGERRVAGDLDNYQFWKPINQSADQKEACARRAANSYDRCRIVNHLNSGVGATMAKGAMAAASPLVNTLDFAGCVALFTGVGGAVYSGVKAGITGGAVAGLRAGGGYLGSEVVAAGKALTSPLGLTLTAGGIGLSEYYYHSALDNYNSIKGRHASGLASSEELQQAEEALKQAELSNNLQTILVGAFLPSGGGKATAQKLAKTAEKTKTGLKRIIRGVEEIPTTNPDIKIKVRRKISVDENTIDLHTVDIEDITPPPPPIRLRTKDLETISYDELATVVENPGPTSATQALNTKDMLTVNYNEVPTVAANPLTVDINGSTPYKTGIIVDRSSPTVVESAGAGIPKTRVLREVNEGTAARSPVALKNKNSVRELASELSIEVSYRSQGASRTDTVTLKSIDSKAGEVVANMGVCCAKDYAISRKRAEHNWKNVLDNDELNPYFAGHVRKVDSPRIRAGKLDGYSYKAPKELNIDFNKEFPDLGEIKLRTFDLDAKGNLTLNGREEAIDYIRKNYPDAHNLDITYLEQGGFSAVFKACPKDGGRCKVIKLPGYDKEEMMIVIDLENQVANLNKRYEEARIRISEPNLDGEDLTKALKEFDEIRSSKEYTEKYLEEYQKKLRDTVASFRRDLTMTAWGDQTLAPGRAPKLDGEEFLSFGSINRDPKLLQNGMVVQDFYGSKVPAGMEKHSEELAKVAKEAAADSTDYIIASKFDAPQNIKADINTYLEFSSLCSKANSAAVKTYCDAFMKENKVPDHKQLERMTVATMNFYEDTHQVVAQAVYEHFGVTRGNPVKINGGEVVGTRIVGGKAQYSAIGFDPLGGKNIFFDTYTGKVVLPDI